MKKHALTVMGLFLFLVFTSPCSAEEIKHTVVKGDTLWDISTKYLKTPWNWPLLWANNDKITNPHLIYPGDMVVIAKDGNKTIIKIIPSPDRGGTVSQMTMYSPEEAASVKGKSIFISPQYSTYLYCPHLIPSSGKVVKKIEGGEIISQGDHIIINSTTDLKVNQAITLVSREQDIKNKDKRVGFLYRAAATAKVEEVQSSIAKARIVYALQEAKVGNDVLGDLSSVQPITLKTFEPVLKKEVRVIDYYGNVTGASPKDLIFLDAGKNHGLNKGAILSITKPIKYTGKSDEEQEAVFHEYSGLVLVLQSLYNSSMGLLLESKFEIVKGDVAVGKE